jgi:methylthioribose-1-phosphate isomerase
MLSLAAHANKLPVICVFPTSTLDRTISDGNSVEIEERAESEVLDIQFMGEQVAPANARARNPAFDVTPHELVSAWVTENGIFYPPFRV